MKAKKTLIVIASLLLVFGMLAGCAKAAPTPTAQPVATTEAVATTAATAAPEKITLTDALGRTVELDSLPQRIVVAGKSVTLISDALFMFPEAVDRVISYGVGSQTGQNFLSVIDPKLADKTGFENTVGAEQIAPLNPDLVILKDILADSLGKQLETLGIKVVYLNLETPQTYEADVRTIGQIFGDPQRAEELVAYEQQSVSAVTDKVKGVTDANRPKVLLLQYSNKGGTVAFKVAPAQWLQTMMVQMAGGNPIWTEASDKGGWAVVTLEQIAAWKPDMIFIVDYSGKALDTVTALKSDPQWQVLDAVKNGKLYAFPVDFLSWDQPDPRWTLGLTWLASKIQPELVGNLDIQAEMTTFYKTVYGLDEATIKDKVLPLYKGD